MRTACLVFGLVGVVLMVYAVTTPGSQFVEAFFGGVMSGAGFTAWWDLR